MSDVVKHKAEIVTTPETTKFSPKVLLRDYYSLHVTK